MVRLAAVSLAELPNLACPNDEAVGVVTLHPQWIAKSYHPQQLLNAYELRQVGSRPVTITPEEWTRKGLPSELASSELYVAGSRGAFLRWAMELRQHPEDVSDQIRRVESVTAPSPVDRLRNLPSDGSRDGEEILLEVVLHAGEGPRDQFILSGFSEYAGSLGAEPDLDRRLYAGGLCFLPVEAARSRVIDLAKFAFLRTVRPMPRLRGFPSIERSVPSPELAPAPLPADAAVDPDLRIAVFDGGLSASTRLAPWVNSHESRGVQTSTAANLTHGHDVTSALLFGPLTPGKPAPRPYCVVDHYRVLDKQAQTDPLELYDVLHRVNEVLRDRNYQFFNLSIGPSLPVEDEDVHPWTALLDQYLSGGDALASFAVGNTGLEDRDSGEARIQVPADCVNGLSVGSADSLHADWKRAPYSSFGPGRSPGVVKPDVVQFGGSTQEPFLVYDGANAPALGRTCGTSLASPAALRLAVGVRAHFGSRIGPLALKALLVHSAEPSLHHKHEVGWGRVPTDLATITTCDDGMVRVIYQGSLSPSQYLHVPIPLPDDQLLGMVGIEATFCYATRIDPQDPGAYTQSGLEVVFRPHRDRFHSDEATAPASQSFFKKSALATDQVLRNDAQKWETTLNARCKFRAKSLFKPVFQIHYNARSAGGAASGVDDIRYALVVTVRAARVPDLYDRVVRAFAGHLEALVPLIEIPVMV
jgi:hypothetical protein